MYSLYYPSFTLLVYFWGSRFFTSLSPEQLPALQKEGRELISEGVKLESVREVLDRPNGHGVIFHYDTLLLVGRNASKN